MQLPNTRPDERFFFSRYVPRPVVLLELGVLKCTVWLPYPFISLAIGKFWDPGPKVRALQLYLGVAKCDGTQTFIHKQVVMTYTWKELAAFRIHNVAVDANYLDQGGS
jgi:hypothetical protein